MEADFGYLKGVVFEGALTLSPKGGLLTDLLHHRIKSFNRLDSSLNDCTFAFSSHGTEC
jgi:hypothetical protein